MLSTGIYEQLINKIVSEKLDLLTGENFYFKKSKIEKNEASAILTQYLTEIINFALNLISGEDSIEKQIKLSNDIVLLLKKELNNQDFSNNILENNTLILNAILPKLDSNINDFENYLKEITPYTGLIQSELFTGSNAGVSLESEIKKEILSSDKIYLLVSFIKWTGIRIFEKELRQFTSSGKKLKIITTSYMGATDLKAVEFLSSLPNTEVKV